MDKPTFATPSIPAAPHAIAKGSSLADLLDTQAILYLARNLEITDSNVDTERFVTEAQRGIDGLSLINRGRHIADALHRAMPYDFEGNVTLLLKTLTPELSNTDSFGLSGFFYLPHTSYISAYGQSAQFNGGEDPFETAMHAQYEVTKRATSEFSIRYFLRDQQARTLDTLRIWMSDDNPHVRRLCSEGTRPRLPWGIKLHAFDTEPELILPLLEQLKDDEDLYVRRSVANNLGDIAKANPDKVFDLCESWLSDAGQELKWLVRHAVRYHAKKAHPRALAIRQAAK